jgi:hypothetical protein
LYVEEHDNVSILYADVVNYSQLTVSLPPKKLVETLNELFTRFDEASEVSNCQYYNIKIYMITINNFGKTIHF